MTHTPTPHITIIAEAGVNHNGSFHLACRLAEIAKNAGADYVKFQTFIPEKLISCNAPQADYQKKNTASAQTQLEMIRKIMLDKEQFAPLKKYCDSIGISFLSTPFDSESIRIVADLDMDYMKIPSGEITNLPYLRAVAKVGLPVIMSTGMSNMSEIEDALNILVNEGIPLSNITLLHCNTEYPTPYADVNLRAMTTLRQTFGTRVGYSDHTRGIEVAIAAAAMGAEVIEKHFTIDRNLPGPDHLASLQPDELTEMVNAIRHIELALGSPSKLVTQSELKNRPIARKSIVAAKHIRKGDIFTEDNLTLKRPGDGISPMLWDKVIGTISPADFLPDQQITLK